MLKFPLTQTLKYHLKWKKVYKDTFSQIPDRKIFHDLILPGLAANPSVTSLLDIGCEWYNLHHQRLFVNQEYTTIDIEADRAAFGAKRHVQGSVLELESHFKAGEFDLVLANGIIGHGVTKSADVQKMASQLAYVLKPGGLVLMGWNDRGEGLPEMHPEEALLAAGFVPKNLPSFGTSKHLANVESKHWYELYEKVDSSAKATS